MAPPRDCPCHSMLRYAACCGPIHAGTRKAETPEALMRSRYAAFALGLGEYLVETLASTHSDVADLANVESPRQELVRALSRARERQRFLALRILHKEETDGGKRGEVLFFARIFERGQDVSFAELSSFVRENGAWRYAEGVLVPGEKLPRDGEGLTRGLFLELAHAEGG